MDKLKGLGHVMDINVKEIKSRRVWQIKNFPNAYIDLYITNPIWKQTNNILCKPLAKFTTNKDLLLLGDGGEDYMAKMFSFTIINSDNSKKGITPAQLHILNFYKSKFLRIFLPFVAYGQLTTGNKYAQVIPVNQGIENNEDLDFLQPKSTKEIIVFDYTKINNLNAYLKMESTKESPELTPWQKAFEQMYGIHCFGGGIGHSYAENAVIVDFSYIQWIDATGFDKIPSILALKKDSDNILVANFKKLLDINRLLINNSLIEHIAGTPDYDIIYYEIYKFTQDHVEELKNVIFFSKRFVASPDAALTDNPADIYASRTALMSENQQIIAHIKVIYDSEEVKSKNDVPKIEDFIEKIKSINMKRAMDYLRNRLDNYLKSLQIFFQKQQLNNMSKVIYNYWTFADQHLFIVFKNNFTVGPILMNASDKKLYYEDSHKNKIPVLNLVPFHLETTNEDITDEKENIVWFEFSPDEKSLYYYFRGSTKTVDIDKLSSVQQFKLSPKNQTIYSTVDDGPKDHLPQSKHSSPPPNLRPQPVPLPILPTHLSPTPTRIIQQPVQRDMFYPITLDNSNIILASEFIINHQPIPCPIYYKVRSDINRLEYYYLLSNRYCFFQPSAPMKFLSYDLTTGIYLHKPELSFLFLNDSCVYFLKNQDNDGRYNLLLTPLILQKPTQ